MEAGAARLYDTSVLHQIQIQIAPEDARRILSRTSERVRSTFTIDGRTLKNGGVRQSGGIYHPYVPIAGKPSLSVKFDEFVPGQELFDLDKLILKNELQDISFLSEHLTYEIFRRAGLAAPLAAHARVVINGIDLGIYLMREPVEKSFRRGTSDPNAKNGNLYEVENVREFVNDPSYPKLDDEGKNGRNRSDLVAFAAAIRAARPETFAASLAPMVDIDRLVTYVAAEMATAHWDGLTYRNNNTYIYALPTGGGRFVFLPYGADQALGISRDGFPGFMGRQNQIQSYLVQRMMSVPGAGRADAAAEIARIQRAHLEQGVAARSHRSRGDPRRSVSASGRMASDLRASTPGDLMVEALIRARSDHEMIHPAGVVARVVFAAISNRDGRLEDARICAFGGAGVPVPPPVRRRGEPHGKVCPSCRARIREPHESRPRLTHNDDVIIGNPGVREGPFVLN